MESGYDIVATTVIGNTETHDNTRALTTTTHLRDAYRHQEIRHLVDPDLGELSDAFIMLTLNRYSMRTSSFVRSGNNLFSFQPEKSLAKNATPLHQLVRTVIRRICIEQTINHLIDDLLQQREEVRVIVFGNGLDTFALRLRHQRRYQSTQLTIFDVDFPGELRDSKLFALNRLGMMGAHPLCHFGKLAPNLHFIKCDPKNENWLEPIFVHKHFSNDVPTILVGDGFGCLHHEDVTDLLKTFKSELPNESTKFFICLNEPQISSSENVSLIHTNTTDRFAITPSSVPLFIRKLGLQVEAKILAEELNQYVKELAQEESENASSLPPLAEHFYLLGNPQWTNVCKLDDLDVHAVPSLKLQVPVKPNAALMIAP